MTGRLEKADPGFVRTRRGVRAVFATVSAWATMVAVTASLDVDEPLRITLFAAGAAFEGALLAADPQPRDRLRTIGWAAIACAVAVVATVQLSLLEPLLAAGLLVLLMFLSFALRSWSVRVASLALIGAITVYITGGGHITTDRLGWFALSAAVGFGWLALWEHLILPDDPIGSLQLSIQAFARRSADTVAGVMDLSDATRDGTSSPGKVLRARLEQVRTCRSAIERQIPGAVVHGLGEVDAEQLKVAVHSAHKALEDMITLVEQPDWTRSLPEAFAESMITSLQALAVALRGDLDDESRDIAAREAQMLRGHIHDALAQTEKSGAVPFDSATLLAAATLLGDGETVAESVTQAMALASILAKNGLSPRAAKSADATPAAPDTHADRSRLSPTMALAIQAVVAAVAAGGVAALVGNEQRLVVAWTAFVIIAGSAGVSTRRAMVRIPATVLGAVSGVLIAATVPETVGWTVAVVAVGVFFTIVTAPVSYPAMVFWMSIAFVPLFATEGHYLELVIDKGIAALIGGCVAAVVALTVAPVRASREVRPAVVEYLSALDAAVASHLPGDDHSTARAESRLDSTYTALTAEAAAAASELTVFSQSENVANDVADRVSAVHDAYLRLSPLLSAPSRLLHGWSDEQVLMGLRRLRAAIERTQSTARGEAVGTLESPERNGPAARAAASLGLSDSVRRVENLHARLADLASVLDSPGPSPATSSGGRSRIS
ncbi:MAG: FUSC family protein [Mycobacterium sp.]